MKLTKSISFLRMIQVRRAMLWVALLGLFASTYLLIVYITGGPIACGIVSGCDVVRASEWAYPLGIPRPALGVVFYVGILALLVIRLYSPKHRPLFWTTLTILATTVGFVESLHLTLIQAVNIGAYCVWCLVSATCATVLFVLSFFEGDRDLEGAAALRELKMTFLACVVALLAGGLGLWVLLATPAEGELPTDVPVMDLIAPVGTEFEGPATATVTIVEFVDIPCPVCRAFEPVMQKIRETYQGRIRFAYRTFMLPEIHENAKESAIAAQCAGVQGKFIPYVSAAVLNQARLAKQDLIQYAEALRLDVNAFETCLADPAMATKVENERKVGEQLGVNSTPSLLLNTTLIRGGATFEQLSSAIDEELRAASSTR